MNRIPFIEKDGEKIHYALSGAANAPVIVFSNSLGANFSMWDPQVPEVEQKFRVLRYDTRGHGQSSVTPGPYSIEQLARDVLTLLDALNIPRANFCGLSMGGMIGMWLGLNAPSRLEKLVLCNTGAKIGSEKGWNSRIEMVRKDGLKTVAAAVIERWLTPDFRTRAPQVWESALRMLEASPPEGYAACCAAVRDYDAREKLAAIRVPALVIAGGKDSATPPADGRFIAGQIPGARYVELDAAHLSNIEASERFTAELIQFLSA
jgi:3-oxoadipate enol-lactonase